MPAAVCDIAVNRTEIPTVEENVLLSLSSILNFEVSVFSFQRDITGPTCQNRIRVEGEGEQHLEAVTHCRLVQGNLRDAGQHEGRGLLGFFHLV